MNRNQETIEKIKSKVESSLSKKPQTKDNVRFNLKDVKIESAITLQDKILTEEATKKVLDLLNVKPSFTEYQKSMSEKDWESVAERIKDAKGDIYLFGELRSSDKIDNVFLFNPKKKKADDMTNSLAIVENIESELAQSEVDYSLYNFQYDKEKSIFDIELRNELSEIELIKDDPWKIGNKFIFNSVQFAHMPFFERLVCSNGMYRTQLGFGSNIGKMSFNNERIEKTIHKSLNKTNDDHFQILEHHANILRNTNISIEEFLAVKNWFNRGERKDIYKDITGKYFLEDPFYKAFGLPISEQSRAWKKTANSGINAYRFLNLLTWIASHPEKSGIVPDDSKELKILAGNFFFKEKFDLQEVAPEREVEYPIFDVAN